MTHPTRVKSLPKLKEAVAEISDDEMTRMCLCVNQMFGNAQAVKLMNLIMAARKEAK